MGPVEPRDTFLKESISPLRQEEIENSVDDPKTLRLDYSLTRIRRAIITLPVDKGNKFSGGMSCEQDSQRVHVLRPE